MRSTNYAQKAIIPYAPVIAMVAPPTVASVDSEPGDTNTTDDTDGGLYDNEVGPTVCPVGTATPAKYNVHVSCVPTPGTV